MTRMTPRPAPTASRTALRASLIAACALTLVACQSARFGGPPRAAVATGPGQVQSTFLEPGIAAPTSVVESQELAPPPGAGVLGDGLTQSGEIISDVPSSPQTAAIPAPAQAQPRVSRTTFVGTWRASEPGGGSCRVTLSSASSARPLTERLDLGLLETRTSAASRRGTCATTRSISTARAGAVAARLRASPGAMQGVLSALPARPVALAR